MDTRRDKTSWRAPFRLTRKTRRENPPKETKQSTAFIKSTLAKASTPRTDPVRPKEKPWISKTVVPHT
jgi:hypothetical protein